MQEVLHYLKKSAGQRMDFEIAEGMRISLESVRDQVTKLAAINEVVICKLVRYEGAKKIEGWLCRVSGYIPPAAPGRKPKGSVAH